MSSICWWCLRALLHTSPWLGGACSSGRHLRTRFQTRSSDHCSIVTGGECFIWGCDSTRGGDARVECVEGYCLCKTGFCNLNGACVNAPEEDDTSKLWQAVSQSIRWDQHPEKCMIVVDSYLRMADCGASPQQFTLPVGQTGQLKIGETGQCVGMLTTSDADGSYAGPLPCDISDPRQEFAVPNGGTGLIRWSHHPDMCLAVTDGSVVAGTPLTLHSCESSQSIGQFGMSFEPPPSHLGCTTGAGCSMLKDLAVKALCGAMPNQVWCRRLKQCPPGGCKNGDCIDGICVCKLGFSGPLCETHTSGPVPINGFAAGSVAGASAVAADVHVFGAPGPAPGPATAAGTLAIGR